MTRGWGHRAALQLVKEQEQSQHTIEGTETPPEGLSNCLVISS